MSRDAELRDVLRLLGKCPQGRWRATPSHAELGERFQNIDVMDGDTIAATVGYLTLPNAEHFGPSIAAAINFLRKHGEALATGRDEDGALRATIREASIAQCALKEIAGGVLFDGTRVSDDVAAYAATERARASAAYDAARQAQHDAQEPQA
jgi:hypothetical protein